MGTQGLSLRPAPEPKATCPSCHRPVAMLKSGRCLYCAALIPGALHVVEPARGLPPDLMLSLQARTVEVSSRTRWIRRMIAFGVAIMLVAAVMGPCMKA